MIDIVVAGGGPAGLMTALQAARSGLHAVVVEPRPAPIDKACGEGLMPGAVRALERVGVGPAGWPFRGIRYTDGERSAVADFRRGTGLGVRRTDLQRELHRAAREAGVEIVDGRVTEVGQDERSVTAAGLRARYLVAADGLHSDVRRRLGLGGPPGAATARWGIRAHFACAPWTDRVEVHWAEASEAYVTPIGPACVGVAVLGRGRMPFADRLAAFPSLVERLPNAPIDRVRGAGPFRQRVSNRRLGRVLLVGDAAGYVDALTGEGLAIAFACAEALVGRVATGSVEQYERDYRVLTRRYRLITAALLSAATHGPLRRHIVPIAAGAPWLFSAAVGQLAR